MSISSLSSLLNQSSIYSQVPKPATDPAQFQQQLAVNSTDSTSEATSNDSSTTLNPAVQGGGHHHHRSFGSGKVDDQKLLDSLTQAFGEDAADEVTTADGSVDLTKLSTLLGTKTAAQSSALSSSPLLDLTA